MHQQRICCLNARSAFLVFSEILIILRTEVSEVLTLMPPLPHPTGDREITLPAQNSLESY